MRVSYTEDYYIAGENLADKKVVYLCDITNKVFTEDATHFEDSCCSIIGITDGSVLEDEKVLVVSRGKVNGFINLSVGNTYYLSQTEAGEITNVKPTSGIIISIGIAITTTDLLLYAPKRFSYREENEIAIKVYSQDEEPALSADQKMAIWIDTNDSNKVYIVFRRGSEDQVKVELI